MPMIAGAILVLAAAVCASGYQIAQALNKFSGGGLLFLAWVFGGVGVYLMATEWWELHKKTTSDEKAKKK